MRWKVYCNSAFRNTRTHLEALELRCFHRRPQHWHRRHQISLKMFRPRPAAENPELLEQLKCLEPENLTWYSATRSFPVHAVQKNMVLPGVIRPVSVQRPVEMSNSSIFLALLPPKSLPPKTQAFLLWDQEQCCPRGWIMSPVVSAQLGDEASRSSIQESTARGQSFL